MQIQVKDLDISRVSGIEGHVSIKEAWAADEGIEYEDDADHKGEYVRRSDHDRRYCDFLYGCV